MPKSVAERCWPADTVLRVTWRSVSQPHFSCWRSHVVFATFTGACETPEPRRNEARGRTETSRASCNWSSIPNSSDFSGVSQPCRIEETKDFFKGTASQRREYAPGFRLESRIPRLTPAKPSPGHWIPQPASAQGCSASWGGQAGSRTRAALLPLARYRIRRVPSISRS
jgi:hypothetical protein